MDRRAAQGGRAAPLARAHRTASERRPAHRDMAGRQPPARTAKQLDEVIAGSAAAGCRARMPRPAAAVDLARRNTGQADARTLGAPDRTVAVPDRDRGAGEDCARRDYGGENERDHRTETVSLRKTKSGRGAGRSLAVRT